MAKYQKYAEYKDSGVEWLGAIPGHWGVTQLKRLGKFITGMTPSTAVEAYYSDEITEYGWIRPEDILEESEKVEPTKFLTKLGWETQRTIPAQSTLICCIGTIGKLGFLGKRAVTNQQITALVPDVRGFSKYYYYLLTASRNQLEHLATGNVVKILNSERLGSLWLPLLSSQNEARQIVHFLDYETAKIDHLIEKQQQLIELLKEKRQAVISHAVTKGLNPNVPMKDSGVEWLGEVPEHWTVTRAKFVSDIFVPQRNKPELNDMEGYSWVTMDDMKNEYIQSVNRYVTKNSAMLAGSKILKKRAVIASCVGNFGITSINNIDVIINQQLQAFIPRNIKAEYLQNLVSISKKYFELIGTAATLVYVNQEGFQNLPVLLPPYDEQVAICVQIENDENKYDQLIHLGLKQIKILQERRTALISSAVTGKIDLRNWQSPTVAEAQTEFSA